MARLSKRETPKPEVSELPQTDAVVGRDLREEKRRKNEEAADAWEGHEGQPCQYYDDGWRYGHVEKVPASDEPRYGEIRVVHAQTGRAWVDARDVRGIV